jgi:diacylglycerol O-acyltransferase / wax synthase
MPHPRPPERFGALDAVFLNFESKEMPLHIGVAAIFDGPIPFERFVASIESKLDQIPRYRQKVVRPALNVGQPTWQDDPNFDIHRHFFHLRLDPPGTQEQLRELTGRIFTERLDREKPLWQCYVVDGLENGRSALVTKVHHCMVDGVAGVGLMNIMLDPSPDERPLPARHKHFHALKAPDTSTLFREGLTDSVTQYPSRLLQIQQGLFAYGATLMDDPYALPGLERLATLLPEMVSSLEKLPFNRPCSGERHVYWSDYSFAEARAIRTACQGTINDVVLTVVSGAVSRYVKLHHQTVTNRFFRAMVPVNLRPPDEDNGAVGNRISLLPVVLPLGIADPVARLKHIHEETQAMKGARMAELVRMGVAWLGLLPPALQALAGKLDFLNTPIPLFHMVCTNVPGPQIPLYAAGRRMLTSYPHVPTGMDVGISLAVQSYDGRLFFALSTDGQAAPDGGRMKGFLDASWKELRKAAGVAEIKPHVHRTRKPRVRHKAAEPAAADTVTAPPPVSEPAGVS